MLHITTIYDQLITVTVTMSISEGFPALSISHAAPAGGREGGREEGSA